MDFPVPFAPDDPDGTLGREQLDGLPKLLVVLYEEPLQVHEAAPGPSGSSLAARARYPRPFSRNSSAKPFSSSPLSRRSFTNAANSSSSGPKTAEAGPSAPSASGRLLGVDLQAEVQAAALQVAQ